MESATEHIVHEILPANREPEYVVSGRTGEVRHLTQTVGSVVYAC